MARRSKPASDAVTFEAAWAPHRKCCQADTDGEVTITLVVPESDALTVMSAYLALRECAFRVTLTPME